MTCEACNERRQAMLDALFEGRLLAAAGHAAKGAAEMVGLKAQEEPRQTEPRTTRKPRKVKP